jgi:hypothetical protein
LRKNIKSMTEKQNFQKKETYNVCAVLPRNALKVLRCSRQTYYSTLPGLTLFVTARRGRSQVPHHFRELSFTAILPSISIMNYAIIVDG